MGNLIYIVQNRVIQFSNNWESAICEAMYVLYDARGEEFEGFQEQLNRSSPSNEFFPDLKTMWSKRNVKITWLFQIQCPYKFFWGRKMIWFMSVTSLLLKNENAEKSQRKHLQKWRSKWGQLVVMHLPFQNSQSAVYNLLNWWSTACSLLTWMSCFSCCNHNKSHWNHAILLCSLVPFLATICRCFVKQNYWHDTTSVRSRGRPNQELVLMA